MPGVQRAGGYKWLAAERRLRSVCPAARLSVCRSVCRWVRRNNAPAGGAGQPRLSSSPPGGAGRRSERGALPPACGYPRSTRSTAWVSEGPGGRERCRPRRDTCSPPGTAASRREGSPRSPPRFVRSVPSPAATLPRGRAAEPAGSLCGGARRFFIFFFLPFFGTAAPPRPAQWPRFAEPGCAATWASCSASSSPAGSPRWGWAAGRPLPGASRALKTSLGPPGAAGRGLAAEHRELQPPPRCVCCWVLSACASFFCFAFFYYFFISESSALCPNCSAFSRFVREARPPSIPCNATDGHPAACPLSASISPSISPVWQSLSVGERRGALSCSPLLSSPLLTRAQLLPSDLSPLKRCARSFSAASLLRIGQKT